MEFAQRISKLKANVGKPPPFNFEEMRE